MAPCPACSPHAPKYYQGSFTWFPEESVYRCIGRDCASHHIGTAEARVARREYEATKQQEADFEFVFDNLGLVPAMVDCADRALVAAGEIEKIGHQFGRVGAVRTALHNAMRDSGRLILHEAREVSRMNPWTNTIESVTERIPIGFGVIRGASLLRSSLGFSTQLRVLHPALGAISRGESDAAQNWVYNSQTDVVALAQCRAILQHSTKTYNRVLGKMRDAISFFSEENFDRLRAFGNHPLNDNRFFASHTNGEFRISFNSRHMRVKPNLALLDQLPPWPTFKLANLH
jgi:hypothetical protein